MARITVEDCIDKFESRFEIIGETQVERIGIEKPVPKLGVKGKLKTDGLLRLTLVWEWIFQGV